MLCDVSFLQSPHCDISLAVCELKRMLEFKFYLAGCPHNMSRIVRKPDFCLCENKGADQLRGNREADQRLCFRYTDSIFPLLLISEISSF